MLREGESLDRFVPEPIRFGLERGGPLVDGFDCIRSRKDPICDVEVGHRSASVRHLEAISLRTGLKLPWDPAREVFIGEHAKEGNGYVAREMRRPYDYTFVS